MKIVGLITEYNPFHNGHEYHIQQALKTTDADFAVVIMSGDFVQRGAPAIMPKRIRTQIALLNGASAVFELPVVYSASSAELFAQSSVSFLSQLGIVDYLCFGSECGNLEQLQKIADILEEEPENYRLYLQTALKSGLSFPAARQKAVESCFPAGNISHLLSHPNNILGIEYLKALRKLKSRIRPVTIQRIESGYHDQKLGSTYSSASAIRNLLSRTDTKIPQKESSLSFGFATFQEILEELNGQIPQSGLELLENYHHLTFPIYMDDFSLLLKHRLLTEKPEKLATYADVSEELANRISNQLNRYVSLTQFSDLLKTREITQTRINRALLHILLGIKKKSMKDYIQNGYHFYAHLLGFRKDATQVISAAAKKGSLPILTQLTRTEELSSRGKKMLKKDIFSSNLYNSVITDKYQTAFLNEYNRRVIKL